MLIVVLWSCPMHDGVQVSITILHPYFSNIVWRCLLSKSWVSRIFLPFNPDREKFLLGVFILRLDPKNKPNHDFFLRGHDDFIDLGFCPKHLLFQHFIWRIFPPFFLLGFFLRGFFSKTNLYGSFFYSCYFLYSCAFYMHVLFLSSLNPPVMFLSHGTARLIFLQALKSSLIYETLQKWNTTLTFYRRIYVAAHGMSSMAKKAFSKLFWGLSVDFGILLA